MIIILCTITRFLYSGSYIIMLTFINLICSLSPHVTCPQSLPINLLRLFFIERLVCHSYEFLRWWLLCVYMYMCRRYKRIQFNIQLNMLILFFWYTYNVYYIRIIISNYYYYVVLIYKIYRFTKLHFINN